MNNDTEYCHLCHEGVAVTNDGVCSACADKFPLKQNGKSIETAVKYANTLDWSEKENKDDLIKKLRNAINNLLYILEDYEGTNAEMEMINKAKKLLEKGE